MSGLPQPWRTGDVRGLRTPVSPVAASAPDLVATHPVACPSQNDPCPSYHPGHGMHLSHARYLASTPNDFWRGFVLFVEDLWVWVGWAWQPRIVRLWHHRDLSAQLPVGIPVRVHRRYHALSQSGIGWYSVAEWRRTGPLPEPRRFQALPLTVTVVTNKKQG